MGKEEIEEIYNRYETSIDKIYDEYIKDIEEIYDRTWKWFNITMCAFLGIFCLTTLIAFLLG